MHQKYHVFSPNQTPFNCFALKIRCLEFGAFVLQAIVRLTDDSERLQMLQAVYDTYDLQPVPAGDASDAPQPNSCRFVFIGEYPKT
jgi:hypothetical protein